MSPSAPCTIRRGQPNDMAVVRRLLEGAGLPTEDLAEISDLRLWLLEAGGEQSGVIALECFGRHGLMRSLAVAPEHRKRGFGRELVARLERDARAQGITQLTLLTETAEEFFRQLGYERIDRADAPEDVRQSAQFRSLCPASAACMTRSL